LGRTSTTTIVETEVKQMGKYNLALIAVGEDGNQRGHLGSNVMLWPLEALRVNERIQQAKIFGSHWWEHNGIPTMPLPAKPGAAKGGKMQVNTTDTQASATVTTEVGTRENAGVPIGPTTQEVRALFGRMGITTLPLVFRTKQPAVGWKELPYREATAEEQREIEQRFTDGQPYGLASVCGLTRNGLYHLVLDVDNEDGAKGFLSAHPELNQTLTIRTPRGFHFHLLSRKPVANYGREARLPFGVEVLGRHLAVIPPSVNEQGESYKIVSPDRRLMVVDNFEATMRRWFPEWGEVEKQKQTDIQSGAGDGEDYWEKLLHGVSEGERDTTCIRLAGHYKGKGISQGEVQQILYSYAQKCNPPFPSAEVDKCIRSAYSYPDEVKASPAPPPEPPTTGIQIQLLDKILEETSEVAYIWDGIIFAGSSNILVAKPKVGKSTLALGLALRVANAEEDTEFLGRRVCKRSKVIYLSLDEHASVIKQRLGNRKAGGNFYIAEACPTTGALLKLIEENAGAFLIIDTLQKLFGSKIQDLNDYAQVVNALAPIQNKARQTNSSILFIHHGKKLEVDEVGDNALGSTALFGGCDTLLEMKIKEKERVLSSSQRVGTELEGVVVRLNEDGEIISEGTLEEIRIRNTEEWITPLLKDSAGLTTDEIVKHLSEAHETISRAPVVKALTRMENKGYAKHTGAGKRSDPKRFSLAE
jgi:hypothetical protein